MRERIFISHAQLSKEEKGLDNDFSLWLYLQLVGIGYKVWCDMENLKGGEDFWDEIENEIRNNTIKYLYVLSNNSNHREGTLKELAVALKIKKKLKDPHFIIPLQIDKTLSYDDINIDLIRLNSINFKESWLDGLANLLERFREDNVPQPDITDYDTVSKMWQTIFLCGRTSIKKTEKYSSNWFPITHLPKHVYFHRFGDITSLHKFPYWDCRFPVAKYKQYLVTFTQYNDFDNVITNLRKYDPNKTEIFNVSRLLKGELSNGLIDNKNARLIIVDLLNKAFNRFFDKNRLGFYKMSNKRKAYWFKHENLQKGKINKELMIGKMKFRKEQRINWHFGISGFVKLGVDNYFIIIPHIIFTWNGKDPILDDRIQHKCRRKQGKDWWNNHWRNKLLNFMKHFEGSDNQIIINVGSDEVIILSSIPFEFYSSFGYIDPTEQIFPTDDIYTEFIEDEEDEIETIFDEEIE